jgi:hypothetical protein
MCCRRIKEWRELHIRHHHENSNWSSSYSSIKTNRASRFHSEEISGEEGIQFSVVLADFVHFDGEEDLE